MDGERFDAMTRALAAAANRRTLFKSAALALGGLAPFARARLALANATCAIACAGDADCANSQDNCFACCGGLCVSALNDVNNCNGCGIVCPGGPNASCSRGSCLLQCPDGLTACGDGSYCANLANDPQNCISCGSACASGQTCCGAVGCIDLTIDLHNCGACGTDCGIGGRCCGSACVDPNSDAGNCGDCGVACAGDQHCQGAACVARCPAGQLFCDPNCVDAQTDAGNCGGCGNACGGGQSCQGGTCVSVSACPDGQTACGGTCIDLTSDSGNCGACTNACDGAQHCQRGACVSTCASGQSACGGACVDLTSDQNNCGACASACAGQQQCQSGTCVSTCAAGTTGCAGVCVDLTSDRNNCGACGTVCSRDTSCVNGKCIRPQCPKGQTQCQDGCVDTKTDAAHCGGCHNACIGGMTCCGGACVDLKTDPTHCGRCDFACPPGFTCDGKGCVLQSSGTETVGGLRTAGPDLCVTKARTQAELSALLSPAVASSPTPIVTPSPGPSWAQIVKGVKVKIKPAPAALAQTITDAVVQVSACGSANDPARQTALMTDEFAAEWLVERGYTPELLAQVGPITPAPLPPQSWERFATIDHVFALGSDFVSALVTFPPLASSLDPRVERHIFKKDGGGWKLNAIKRADQFTAKTGSLALRLFDCPAGVSAHDPSAACAPTPELQFDYQLISADGTVFKSLADAKFIEAGVLMWNDLPPGVVRVRPIVPSGIGFHVVAGVGLTSQGDLITPVLAGKDAAVVSLFYESSVVANIIARLRTDVTCPPCSHREYHRDICVPSCPPCADCQTITGDDGRVVSSCVSICKDGQVCQSDRDFVSPRSCCTPIGGGCSVDGDCCKESCQNGVCACAPVGAACNRGYCCPGAECDDQSNPSAPVCVSCGSPIGAACSSNTECCGGHCLGGTCGCCASIPAGEYSLPIQTPPRCCVYPNAVLRIKHLPNGPTVERCCVDGLDCINDPSGPPLTPNIVEVESLAVVCPE